MKKIIYLLSVSLLILASCTGNPEKCKKILVEGNWECCDTITPEKADLLLLQSYNITFVDDDEFLCTIEYAEKEGQKEANKGNTMIVNGWYSYDHPYVRLFSDFFNAKGHFDERKMEVHFDRVDKKLKFYKAVGKLNR